MSLSLGVASNQISLNLLGYAVQNSIFQIMADPSSTMGMLALTCGLIGFVSMLVMPSKMNVFTVCGWLFLVALIYARPVSETLFFTALQPDTAPQLSHTIALGGALTDDEAQTVCGDDKTCAANMPTQQSAFINKVPSWASQDAKCNSEGSCSQLYGFTPELLLVSTLSKVNYDLQTSLLPIGSRALDSNAGTIEALQRGSLSDPGSIYSMAEFSTACSSKPGAKAAVDDMYLSTDQMYKMGKWDALTATHFTALDAVKMYAFYAKYMQQSGVNSLQMYPTLVCPATDKDKTNCGGDYLVASQNADDVKKLMKAITLTSESDAKTFDNARTDPATTMKDIMSAYSSLPGDTPQQKNDFLNSIPVTLMTPYNFDPMARSVSGSSTVSSTAHTFGQSFAKGLAENLSDNVHNTASLGKDCVIGGGIGGAGGAVFGAGVGAVIGAPIGCVLGMIIGHFAGATGVDSSDFGGNVGYVATANSCADFFRINAARLAFSDMMAKQLTQSMADVMADYAKSGKMPSDYSELPPNKAAGLALRFKLTADLKQCETLPDTPAYGGGMYGAPAYSGQTVSDCKDRASADFQALMNQSRMLGAQNALPAAQAATQVMTDPQFIGAGQRMGKAAGEALASGFIWMKSLIGGFEAGTYSQIMPLIVYFGTGLMIMFTPLLYILGLMLPFWSLSIIAIPLFGVAFFQMVLIEFTVINTLGRIMVTASQNQLLVDSPKHFTDILLGGAYCAAFLITGAVLMSLRNPTAAVQQLAGKADQAATVGVKDVLEGAAVLKVASTIAKVALPAAGKALAVAEMVTSAATGGGEGEGGGEGGGMGMLGAIGKAAIAPVMDARDKTLASFAERDARIEFSKGKGVDYYQNRATGRYLKQEEEDMASLARASGNGAMNRTYTMGDGHGGHEKVDSMIDTLASALRKGGLQAGQAFKQAADYMGQEGRGGMGKMMSVDKDAREKSGSIVYRMSEDGAKALAAGGLKGQSLEKMKAKMGDSFFEYNHKRKDGTSFKSYGFVARKGPGANTDDFKKDYEEK